MRPPSTTAGSSSGGRRAGERLETLDHVERDARSGDALSSPTRPGRSASPASWAARPPRSADATTDVIVESAIFDPVSIRRTAFRYALRSEASLRFEKGQEFRLARLGADRTAAPHRGWAGGRVAPGAVDSNPVEPPPAHVAFRPARVNRLLGTTLETDEQRALLARVGIETARGAAGHRGHRRRRHASR